MSSPSAYYHSLPPVCKTYVVLCFLFTATNHLGLYYLDSIELIYQRVFFRLEVWRLILNFFYLGPFSYTFAINIFWILQYGVQLENGAFAKRTADFIWMMIFGAFTLLVLSAIPFFYNPFLGVSLVFMLVYVWSREFPTVLISFHGLVTLSGFYVPWAMLFFSLIFGSSLMPELLGIITGHVYYFLTVLHPLATGNNMLKTPIWVHKLAARLGWGPPVRTRAEPNSTTDGSFQGRSYRLGGR